MANNLDDIFGNPIDPEQERERSKSDIQQHELDIDDLKWQVEQLQNLVATLQTTSDDHETRITALEP